MSKELRFAVACVAAATSSLCQANGTLAAAPASIHEQFIQTAPGVRIHVLKAGVATDKPAIVLIPGWRLTASLWRQQMEALSHDRTVIALDPRSQGESTVTAEGDTPENRARDLKAVLQALRLQSVVLVGWSQGVQDVAAFLNKFGTAEVRGLVLVDAPVSPGISRPAADTERLLQYVASYVRDPRAVTEAMAHSIVQQPLLPSAFQSLVSNALKTPSAIGASMLINDLLGPDRTQALARLTVPTLVIAAANSRELDDQREEAAKLPNGHFEVIAESGHAVFIDQPERFEASLRSFLNNSTESDPPVRAGR